MARRNPDSYFSEMDRVEQMRGMVVTTARPQDPELRGWTPHIPSQPRLNSYLDLFNDADLAAQQATNVLPTDEKMINVGMPLAWHFEPAPDGWDLGGITMGEEPLPPQPSMLQRMPVAPSTRTRTEVRSPTSTRTEVRSPTSTSTEVRSPTSTSTDAYTRGNVTVTGGAGAGAYTDVRIYQGLPDRFPERAGRAAGRTQGVFNRETSRWIAEERPRGTPSALQGRLGLTVSPAAAKLLMARQQEQARQDAAAPSPEAPAYVPPVDSAPPSSSSWPWWLLVALGVGYYATR